MAEEEEGASDEEEADEAEAECGMVSISEGAGEDCMARYANSGLQSQNTNEAM